MFNSKITQLLQNTSYVESAVVVKRMLVPKQFWSVMFILCYGNIRLAYELNEGKTEVWRHLQGSKIPRVFELLATSKIYESCPKKV